MNFSGLSNFSASSVMAGAVLTRHLFSRELIHSFFGMTKTRRGRKMSKKQRRRIINRRRRWFVDNIIMHHKRLHDKNRRLGLAISKDKDAVRKLGKERVITSTKWRDHVEIKDRGRIIRGRIASKKARARSRWLSVSDLVF